jgi:hypothetical protein
MECGPILVKYAPKPMPHGLPGIRMPPIHRMLTTQTVRKGVPVVHNVALQGQMTPPGVGVAKRFTPTIKTVLTKHFNENPCD